MKAIMPNMARDFTLDRYSELLLDLMSVYRLMTVADYISMPVADRHVAVIRHDVTVKPESAARMALLEKYRGAHSTYYFAWDPKAVNWAGTGDARFGNFPELAAVEAKLYGHEVGLLSDGTDAAARLEILRKLAPVRTAVGYSSEELIGGPDVSSEFSDFAVFSDKGKRWTPRMSTDALAGLLRSGKHERVMLIVHPENWK